MIFRIITDYDIQAFVDDELDTKEASRVGDFIENNIRARKRFQMLKKQKSILNQLFKIDTDRSVNLTD